MHCEKLKYLNLTALFPPGLSEIKYFLDFVTNQWCKQNMPCFFQYSVIGTVQVVK